MKVKVFIRNIIPDGKKLATFGQCQWDRTSVAILQSFHEF
jgi:hypothetical protein